MRFVSICAALLALAGCAQTELVPGGTAPIVVANTSTEVKPETKLVCHKESPAGSNMIHTVCAAEQTEAERAAYQNKIKDNMASH